VVFQEGRDIVLGEGAHLLQGGAEDGKAVVAAHPEVALAVLEEAVELCGGRLIDGRVFRFCCIDRPQAVGTGHPEAPVCGAVVHKTQRRPITLGVTVRRGEQQRYDEGKACHSFTKIRLPPEITL